jgi:thioredoxin-related protein
MKKIILLSVLVIFSLSLLSQTTPEPASAIMDKAFKAAKKEGKNVMIVFHASWCGWCKKFDASVIDPACKEYFEKNFIIEHLTILENGDMKKNENPGAIDIFNKYAGTGSGIPFFLIYDKKGTLVADSKIRPEGGHLMQPEKTWAALLPTRRLLHL